VRLPPTPPSPPVPPQVQWELDPEAGTTLPLLAPHLVLGWRCHSCLVKRGDASQNSSQLPFASLPRDDAPVCHDREPADLRNAPHARKSLEAAGVPCTLHDTLLAAGLDVETLLNIWSATLCFRIMPCQKEAGITQSCDRVRIVRAICAGLSVSTDDLKREWRDRESGNIIPTPFHPFMSIHSLEFSTPFVDLGMRDEKRAHARRTLTCGST
jgi:hypothetical protein